MTKNITVTGTPKKTMSFNYSANNERELKTESYGTTKNSYFYIRGNNEYPLTEKANLNNSISNRIYVYGPTGLISIKDATAAYFLIKDHLGSTRVLCRVFTNTIDSSSESVDSAGVNDQTGRVQEAQNTYNADGTVKQLQLANSQTMDYLYNERSWLTQINHQNLYNDDKFGEVIGYNEQNHIAAGTGFNFQAQYNGNISWNIMRTKNVGLEGVDAGYPDPVIGYVYNYNGANRLTKADFGYYNLNPDYTIGWSNSLPKAAMYDLPLVSYYANGNIFNLQRKGADALMMDNFAYLYQSNKNRLVSIMNTANGTQIYNYGYDNNGNVTSDQYRDISGITYNISSLPEQLTADGSIVKYWYDNNGNRFRKQVGNVDEVYVLGSSGETEAVFKANGSIKFFNINSGKETIGRFAPTPVDLYLSSTTLSGTYEAQNSITVEDNVIVSGATTLKAGSIINLKPGFHAPNGINFTAKIGVVPNTPKRFYYLKDHLGSIRVTVNEVGEIVSYDDYDPWGMILNGRSTNDAYLNAKYKFTGKERDIETGYDYFGARYYDSRIGRWLIIDPLFEKYPGISPYVYTLNNPVKFIDPDGRWPYIANNNLPTLNEIKSRFSGLNFPSNVNITHQSLLALYKTYIQSQAPKVADWWEHTTFSVTVSSNLYATESAMGITRLDLSVPGIVIDQSVLGDPETMARTLLHESVHNIKINGESGSEFSAWGATLASGLLDETTYLSYLQTAWRDASIKGELSFGYMTSGMDDKLIEMVSQYSSSKDKDVRAELGSQIISRLKEEGSKWIK